MAPATRKTPSSMSVDALLRQSQSILEAVADNSSDAVFVKDTDGRYVLCNTVACRVLGRPVEEIIGRDDSELFSEADAKYLMGVDRQVRESGATQTGEERLHVGGEERIFRFTKGPLRDGNDEVVGTFGLAHDITERVRAERDLRASNAKFRGVFDQSPLGKSITTLSGEVDFNPAMCRMLGYTREELQHVRFQDLTHPDDVELSEREMGALVSGERDTLQFTKRYLHKNGSVVWAEVHATVRRAPDGSPVDVITSIVDITQRRRAEEALSESEQRYRALSEWMPEPLLAHREGIILYANPAALALFHARTHDELTGRSILELIAPSMREFASGRLQALQQGGIGAATPVARGGEMIALDGTPLIVEVQSVVAPYGGEPVVFSVLHDVTAQSAQDQALRESEYFFRESQRVGHIGSYRTDFVAGTWQSSEVLDDIFGIDAGYERNIAGWLSLVHPDDQLTMAQYLQDEVIGKGNAFDREYRAVRPRDGAVRWLHGHGALIRNDEGAVVGMTGTIQDITARHEAEQALRNREERHRAILQTAMDGFWMVDMDARIVEVNETYAKMSGYSVDELLQMRVPDVEALESAAETAEHIRVLMEQQQGRWISRHRRKDGSEFDVEVSAQYRPMDGGQMVAFIQDISARTRAESERNAMQSQLQQAQKMESVGRLAGGVAHDFNNMLGVILGNVDMALEQVPAGDPLREDLGEVRRAAVRSVELTRQLLAFARKQTAAPQVLNLNETVQGMLRMLQRLIGEDVELVWKPAEQLWPVRIDPSQVDQVLANLCVNARDAISGVGTLTIETSTRTLSETAASQRADAVAGDYVVLTVRDDGVGMTDEVKSHLFEPFFTTKAMGKGTGLGLATVWGIVRQNSGFIDVLSRQGEGTAFAIWLPRHVGREQPASAEAAPLDVGSGRETVLLVEDEPAILSLTARMLERHGYVVLRAGTPGEALRIAREHEGQIDLLLTDVVMPEMNGRDLARQVLALYPDIRRMFMSGYTADVIAHRGVLDDGVHFLQKPFTQDALGAKVREALDRRDDD